MFPNKLLKPTSKVVFIVSLGGWFLEARKISRASAKLQEWNETQGKLIYKAIYRSPMSLHLSPSERCRSWWSNLLEALGMVPGRNMGSFPMHQRKKTWAKDEIWKKDGWLWNNNGVDYEEASMTMVYLPQVIFVLYKYKWMLSGWSSARVSSNLNPNPIEFLFHPWECGGTKGPEAKHLSTKFHSPSSLRVFFG